MDAITDASYTAVFFGFLFIPLNHLIISTLFHSYTLVYTLSVAVAVVLDEMTA